ncbi:MAG: FtsW/RodA/SpoVE family cell cycle protein [Patescibacteria group bacterium]
MQRFRHLDWVLILAVVPLLIFGLFTMKSLGGSDYYFWRQLEWIGVGFVVLIVATLTDWRLFKSSIVILSLYAVAVALLGGLVVLGHTTRGVQSWFYIGSAGVEPVEVAKLALMLLLAKYFSGRHVEIALARHIIVSMLYLILPLGLVFVQPDIGSAAILLFLWMCMVLFAGMNMKQIAFFGALGVCGVLVGWFLLLQPYQKARVASFLQPERDPRGSGYHAIQAMIAVGSGGVWGKGVGYGTQSRLNFLPESETDFVFAAFAEEWGLVGVTMIFISFGVIFWRIIKIALGAPENFPRLVAMGVGFLLLGHIIIHVGMNVGLLPITGIGLPFMSYGGSFLVLLMALLGILESIAIRSSIRGYEDTGSLVLSP